MVQTPGASLRARGIRPLNEPRPVEVRIGADRHPTAIREGLKTQTGHGLAWGVDSSLRQTSAQNDSGEKTSSRKDRREWLAVVAVDEIWRVDDEWWREEPIARTFYSVVLEDGRQTALLLDERADAWYMVRA